MNKLCSVVYTNLIFFPFFFFHEFSTHIHFTRTIFIFLTFTFPSPLIPSTLYVFLLHFNSACFRSPFFPISFFNFFSLLYDFKVFFFFVTFRTSLILLNVWIHLKVLFLSNYKCYHKIIKWPAKSWYTISFFPINILWKL